MGAGGRLYDRSMVAILIYYSSKHVTWIKENLSHQPANLQYMLGTISSNMSTHQRGMFSIWRAGNTATISMSVFLLSQSIKGHILRELARVMRW